MDNARVRSGWVGGFALLIGSALLTSCAAISTFTSPAPVPPAPQPAATVLPNDDDDYSQLIAQLRSDLNRYNSREISPKPTIAPQTQSAKGREREFAQRAQALFAPLSSSSLRMPVVGVRPHDLSDSWHDPRSGGRVHKGIDIFASRGTEVVAVADGIISYIGDQRLGGHCVWLTTENGASFYYAHLDRWAPGLYEGMEVQSGDLIGYVGNTGNAAHTPSHLHFAVNQSDEMVNPYPLLVRAIPVQQARMHVTLSGGVGTR